MGNSRNNLKQFISVKLNAVLSCMMKSHTVSLRCLACESSLFQWIHTVCTTCPVVSWQPSQLSDRLSGYQRTRFQGARYFTCEWPQSARAVMLAVWIWQKEAVKCFLPLSEKVCVCACMYVCGKHRVQYCP